jgi:hypothetical protein
VLPASLTCTHPRTNTHHRLESVKELHIILLVISFVCFVLFVLMLYRPYVKLLHRDTRAIINMLSQLPNEVDVEVRAAGLAGACVTSCAPSWPCLRALEQITH